MSDEQLNFIFAHGSAYQTSNPLSVVNAHVATHRHRRRQWGGARELKHTRVEIREQSTQKVHKEPLLDGHGRDGVFIHYKLPPPIGRALSSESTSSTTSFDDPVDSCSDDSSRLFSIDSNSSEGIDTGRNQGLSGRPLRNSAHDSRLPQSSTLSTSSTNARDSSTSSRVMLPSSSIGWFDPFDDFPIKLARHDHLLLNHYKFAIPSKIFGQHRLESYTIQKNLFFPIAMREKTWLFQLLAFASGDRDRRLGLKDQSPTTSRYLCASVRSINEQIADPRTCYSEEMAGAISSAAYVEYHSGRKPAFNAHVKALARILRFRKANCLQVRPDVDAVTISHLLAYCKAYVETLLDDLSQLSHGAFMESPDMQEMTVEVIQSTMLIQKLASWRAERYGVPPRPCENPEDAIAEAMLRHRLQILFAPLSILMSLLREPERMNSPIALIRDSEECYRLFAICYLLLILWDYRNDPEKCLDVCCALETALLDQKITTYTVSPVVWLLLRDHGNDAVRRRWTTLSMVRTLYIMGSEKDAMTGFLLGILQDVGLGMSVDVGDTRMPSMGPGFFRLVEQRQQQQQWVAAFVKEKDNSTIGARYTDQELLNI